MSYGLVDVTWFVPRFRVDPFLRPDDATASLQSHYRTLLHYHRWAPPLTDASVFLLVVIRHLSFSLHIASQLFPAFRIESLSRGSCRLYTGCRWVDLQISLPACSRRMDTPCGFDSGLISFDASSDGFTFVQPSRLSLADLFGPAFFARSLTTVTF